MHAKFPDYYRVLGVPRTATEHEISAAYRSLARKCHPDTSRNQCNSGAEFRQITEAHEVLSDVERRQRYDRMTDADLPRVRQGFAKIVQADLPITPEEAWYGARVPVQLNLRAPCDRCYGNQEQSVCEACDGTGTIAHRLALTLKLPAGAGNSFVMRLLHPARGGDTFELHLRLRVLASW